MLETNKKAKKKTIFNYSCSEWQLAIEMKINCKMCAQYEMHLRSVFKMRNRHTNTHTHKHWQPKQTRCSRHVQTNRWMDGWVDWCLVATKCVVLLFLQVWLLFWLQLNPYDTRPTDQSNGTRNIKVPSRALLLTFSLTLWTFSFPLLFFSFNVYS